MQLTIKWINRNPSADGVRIYRDTNPIQKDTLPDLLTTLPGDATEYIDSTVLFNTQYYYRIAIFKGGDVAWSENIAARTTPYTGPGPQELIVGDWDCGLFGFVKDTELITATTLKDICGVEGSRMNTVPGWWIKFAHKGKILFYYARGICNTNYTTLQATNVVNGDKIISIEEDDFKIRLMQGWSDELEFPTSSDKHLSGDIPSNEWDDLIGKICSEASSLDLPKSIFGNYDGHLISEFISTSNLSERTAMIRPIICNPAYAHGTNSVVVRGGYNCASKLYYPGAFGSISVSSSSITGGRMAGFSLSTANRAYPFWAPVLELVV